MMSDGLCIDATNRPAVPLADRMYGASSALPFPFSLLLSPPTHATTAPFIAAKDELMRVNPTPAEIVWLEQHLATVGGRVSAPPPAGDRRSDLLRAAASIQSLATSVSRLPSFRRRFGAVLTAIVHAATTAPAAPSNVV